MADDGAGLAELWRSPLKIVTLEDLQQADRQAAAASDGAAGDGASGNGGAEDGAAAGGVAGAPNPLPPSGVIDVGGDHG